jgi:phytanoyl-CoA dioxygenase PhyH
MLALQQAIEREGLAIVPGLLSAERVAGLVSDLDRTLPRAGASVLQSRGHVYGIRNLLDVWPAALAVARDEELCRHVGAVLGDTFGLVRSIYFDKPPARTWSLPWHRDLTIAVRDVMRAGGEFRRPTVKAGIPHVEAPGWLLRRMLTVRVALDDVGDENGPLLVVPGSHEDGLAELPSEQDLATRARPVYMRAGDVLLIRPLVVHRSGPSKPGTRHHRRTLHFEFAAAVAPSGRLEWNRFLRQPSKGGARENEPVARSS